MFSRVCNRCPTQSLLIAQRGDPTGVFDIRAVEVQQVKPSKAQATEQEQELYEMLVDLREEATFMVYCLFENMHQIQE